MRSTVLFVALITAIVLSGCIVRENKVTIIGGADGPTAIYLAHEAEGEEDKSPDTNEEEKANGSEEFLAGTWDEDDFSNHYSGSASLSRVHDRKVKNTYESDFGKYFEMDDGTWVYEGRSYKYRLEITGRMNNAAKESTFIYLSNIEDISFDRAVMASGLSSNMADYFSPDEAVFIGWKE